jgi:N-carbamoylputrescine amidase
MTGKPSQEAYGPGDEAVTVAAVQMAAPLGDKERNLRRSLEWLSQAAHAGARLAVLPELCLSGYGPSTREEAFHLAESLSGPSVAAWIDLAAQTGLVIVGGLSERKGLRCYNSAVAVDRNGILGVYRKAHLFERESAVFDPGDTGFPVVDLGFARLGMLVCYDLRFPEAVRTLALSGADIVAVPTAWVTLSGRPRDDRGVCIQAYCAMAHASMNRMFLVCADTVGPFRDTEFLGNSLIVDITGWPVSGPAGPREETLLTASLVPTRARDKHITPYNDILGDRRLDLYQSGESVRL